MFNHIETIWAAKAAWPHPKHQPVIYRRERLCAPDGDFIDVDFLVHETEADNAQSRPLWVMFHGLEGSSQSHYARAFARYAQDHGLNFCVPHFRGCSGELNLAPRAYHSGDYEEIDWILRRLTDDYAGAVYAVGISLGGNALMRWAGEVGTGAAQVVGGAISICSPLDLAASGFHIGRGLNRHLYTPMFLRTMKPRALQKLAQYPSLFDKRRLLASRNLYEFDNVFTAPLHGFKNTDDYWTRASAKPHLASVRVPALAINALNDPFIPRHSLPKAEDVGNYVQLWQPKHGGHVGFATDYLKSFPGHLQTLPRVVDEFFRLGVIPHG
ncbi:MAG: alpha/beta fold hydrolase [Cytophagales bacterium]|nr:alpha/beta fold hydrolase [Cytophagales bacterium]